jgi:hypothetical protein
VAEDDFVWCGLRDADGELTLHQGFHDMPIGSHRFEPVLPGTYEAVLYRQTDAEPDVLARAPITVVGGETVSVMLLPSR